MFSWNSGALGGGTSNGTSNLVIDANNVEGRVRLLLERLNSASLLADRRDAVTHLKVGSFQTNRSGYKVHLNWCMDMLLFIL